MSFFVLILIILLCSYMRKKLPGIASFFYDRQQSKLMYHTFIKDSVGDIRDVVCRKRAEETIPGKDSILEEYTLLKKNEINIQKARKDIEQKDIIKRAIQDELNI